MGEIYRFILTNKKKNAVFVYEEDGMIGYFIEISEKLPLKLDNLLPMGRIF